MRAARLSRSQAIRALGLVTGLALALIGLRFALDPRNAATFFGIDHQVPGFAPHYAIALRDVWLGVLAIALAWLGQWRALSLWFGLAALVCFGDALIAASSSGRWLSISFHGASGVFCASMAAIIWRLRADARDT